MILIVKGRPDRAMCCQCKHLYAPKPGELRKSTTFICSSCCQRIEALFRSFNRREKRKAASA